MNAFKQDLMNLYQTLLGTQETQSIKTNSLPSWRAQSSGSEEGRNSCQTLTHMPRQRYLRDPLRIQRKDYLTLLKEMWKISCRRRQLSCILKNKESVRHLGHGRKRQRAQHMQRHLKHTHGTSLAVQWLRPPLPMQGVRV